MYILQTALKNINRYKIRYITFGVLLFIVAMLGVMSSGVYKTSELIVEQLKYELGAILYVKDNGGSLTVDEIKKISGFPQVNKVETTRYRIAFYSYSLKINDELLSKDKITDLSFTSFLAKYSGMAAFTTTEPFPGLNMYGINTSSDAYINKSETSYISDGRLPQNETEVVINKNFIDVFNLESVNIGSTVILTIGELSKTYNVVGVFNNIDFTSQNHSGENNPVFCCFFSTLEGAEYFNNTDNYKLYGENYGIRFETLEGFQGYETYFYLNSYKDYDGFSTALTQLSDKTPMHHYRAQYIRPGMNMYSDTYEDTQRLSGFIINALLIIGAIIIIIMTVLSMNERRYEIGVLLSVGMNKWRIYLIFASELLIFVTFIMTAGLACGLGFMPDLIGRLIQGVVRVSNVSVGINVAFLMLSASITLALISSAVCALSILRFRPMTILRSRS